MRRSQSGRISLVAAQVTPELVDRRATPEPVAVVDAVNDQSWLEHKRVLPRPRRCAAAPTAGSVPAPAEVGDRYVDVVSKEDLGRVTGWFRRPPRAHGETITGRTVSFLELFYDLVYVAVIGQAAHHLAEHVSLRGSAEFAVSSP